MPLPPEPVRRHVRYPIHLPVSVWFDDREVHTRSENISLRGLLLSSAFLIPEGAAVQLAVTVGDTVFLTARGRVLRVHPKEAGDFFLAIQCETPLGFTRGGSMTETTQSQ